MACEHWHLPETIGHVVGKHHAPSRLAPRSKPEMLVALVHSADIAMFSSAVPGAPSLSEAEEQLLENRVRAPMPDFLRSSVSHLGALIRQSSEEAEASCRGLGVA
jgi:HD-like signal output (HDOD) protein